MDEASFTFARTTLETRLACVGEPLTPTAFARIHLVEAMGAFLEGKSDRIGPALAGMFAADPGHQVPIALIPELHPIRQQMSYAGALLRLPDVEPLAVLPSGWFEVDGTFQKEVPSKRAAILQQVDGNGVVVASRYHWPGDDLGEWKGSAGAMASNKAGKAPKPAPAPKAAPVAKAPKPTPPPKAEPVAKVEKPAPTPKAAAAPLPTTPPKAHAGPHPARVPLAIATGAALVASGTMFALAVDNRANFDDESTAYTDEELRQMAQSGNTLTWGWIGGGAATVLLGVTMVVTW